MAKNVRAFRKQVNFWFQSLSFLSCFLYLVQLVMFPFELKWYVFLGEIHHFDILHGSRLRYFSERLVKNSFVY